jgi:hypothetical protein
MSYAFWLHIHAYHHHRKKDNNVLVGAFGRTSDVDDDMSWETEGALQRFFDRC